MELTMVKDGYDAYLKEIKKRDELVKAIVNNDDYTNIQLEYVDLYEKTNEELGKIREELNKYVTEGDLRREVSMNIKNKMEIGSYEGHRHRRGLPVRGQRTNRNARTRKGKGKVVANKKK